MASTDEIDSAVPHPDGPALGYEPRDLSATGLAKILAVVGATMAAVIGVCFLTLHYYAAADHRDQRPLTREERIVLTPPLPRLQTTTLGEITRLRAHDREMLNSYAWLDADHATARIPIARAMALVVGHSLDAAP
jgi:hypothetical protein